MKRGTLILGLLVAIEAVVIVFLCLREVRLVVNYSPRMVAQHPLLLAIEYDSSDEKFAELVEQYPESLSVRPSAESYPILAECAHLNKTNHVRTLIEHGADIEESVRELEHLGQSRAVALIRAVQAELPPNSGRIDLPETPLIFRE